MDMKAIPEDFKKGIQSIITLSRNKYRLACVYRRDRDIQAHKLIYCGFQTKSYRDF